MTREEAIKYGKEQLEIFGGMHRKFITMAIEALQAETVRHGEWETRKGIEYCSECNKSMMWQSNFCPNCGAKMDGIKEVSND